jgi:hypothetical protein
VLTMCISLANTLSVSVHTEHKRYSTMEYTSSVSVILWCNCTLVASQYLTQRIMRFTEIHMHNEQPTQSTTPCMLYQICFEVHISFKSMSDSPLKNAPGPSCARMFLTTDIPLSGLSKGLFCTRVLITSSGAATVMLSDQ